MADDVELRTAKLEWRVDALDRWRAERVDPGIAEVRREVERLARADEIANAVAERVNSSRQLQLTFWQKAGGLATGALVIADAIKGLIS